MSNNYRQSPIVTLFALSISVILAFTPMVPGPDMPVGAGTPNVVVGGANFNRNGSDLTVTTDSRYTVINWDRFGVAAGSLTQFLQPGVNSATLNRVTGDLPSRVDGTLSSNGALFLVNQNGVVIGSQGLVKADGGFVASALSLTNDEFLRGAGSAMRFGGDGLAGAVENYGVIQSSQGDVFLLGARVSNTGLIEAPRGTAGMAAGREVVIHPVGREAGRMEVIATQSSFVGGTGVDNAGVVRAAAAELRAHGDPYKLAVNNSGLIEARALERTGDGRVFLTAGGASGAAGTVVNDGEIRALKADGSGGEVRLTGAAVELGADSFIDVSAESGSGGLALVGGEWQGGKNLSESERASALASAETLYVAEGARVAADAAGLGDGGTVALWANGSTEYHGSITARGGEAGGDGGMVEVSGKKTLLFHGDVDTTAAMGQTGSLLLDPDDWTINATWAAEIQNLLATSNVYMSSGTYITVESDILWAGTNSLTLTAGGNLTLLKAIIGLNSTVNLNAAQTISLEETLMTANANLSAEMIVFNAPVVTSSALSASAGNITVYSGGAFSGAGSVVLNPGHTFDNNAGAGALGNRWAIFAANPGVIKGLGGLSTANRAFGVSAGDVVAVAGGKLYFSGAKPTLTIAVGKEYDGSASIGIDDILDYKGLIFDDEIGDLFTTFDYEFASKNVFDSGDISAGAGNVPTNLFTSTYTLDITGSITPLPVTVDMSFFSTDKTYGDVSMTGIAEWVTERTGEFVIGGDAVGIAGLPDDESTGGYLKAGSYSGGIALNGTHAGNYALGGDTDYMFKVGPKETTVAIWAGGAYGDLSLSKAGMDAVFSQFANTYFTPNLSPFILDGDDVGSTGDTIISASYNTTQSSLKAGTYGPHALTLTGADAQNYVIRHSSFIVGKKNVTLDLSSIFDSTYEYGILNATAVTGLIDDNYGLVDGDTFTATGTITHTAADISGAGFLNVNDTGYARTIGFSGGDSGNYNVTGTTTSATVAVTKKALSIDLSSLFGSSYEYGILDGTTVAGTANHAKYTDILDGDTFTANMTFTGNLDSSKSGAGKLVVAPSYATAYAAADNGASGNYDITNTVTSGAIEVTQKAISLNLASLFANSYEYGILDDTAKTETLATNDTTGILTSDVVTASMMLDAPGVLSGAGKAKVGTGYAATYALTGGADAGNYSITPTGTTGSVAVTKKDLSVDLSSLFQSSYEYGILGSAGNGETADHDAFGGILDGDTLTVNMTVTNPGTLSGANKVQVGTGYTTSYAAGADGDSGNYNISHTGGAGSVAVTKKNVTIDLSGYFGASLVYGSIGTADTTQVNSSHGLLSGDSFTATGTITHTADDLSGAGLLKVNTTGYARTVGYSGGDSGNYNVTDTTTSATVAVTKKALSIDLSSLFLSSYEYGVLDGTTVTGTANNAKFGGIVAGDTFTANMTFTGNLDSSKSGAGKLVVGGGYATAYAAADDRDSGNYDITNTVTSGTVGVTTKAISLNLGSIFESSYEYGILAGSTKTETIDTADFTQIYTNDVITATMTLTTPGASSGAGKVKVNPSYATTYAVTGGADAGNYSITPTGTTGSVAVTKKDLSVDLSSLFQNSYEYGILGNTAKGETADHAAFGGILDGDTFTATMTLTNPGTLSGASKVQVGTGYATSYAAAAAADDDSGNYNVTHTGTSATVAVTPKALNVDLSSLFLSSYVYGVLDGSAVAGTANHTKYTDILDGDTFTANMTFTGNLDSSKSGAGKLVVAPSYATAYAAADDGDSGNYDITNTVLTGTIGVTQKAISLNLANLFANSYEYGILDNTAKTETFATNATTGIFTNDVVTASMTLDTPGTLSGAGKAKVNSGYATTYALAGGADAGNYSITPTGTTGSVAVTKKDLSVDLSTLFQSSYEYGILGNTAKGETADHAAFSGILDGDTFTANMTVTNPGTLSGASKIQVGTGYATSYVAAAAADDDSGNYNVTHSGSAGSVDVTKKNVTIDLSSIFDSSYEYGILDTTAVTGEINGTYGLVSGDSFTASGAVVYPSNALSGAGFLNVNSGYTREISYSGGDSGNYNVTGTGASATVAVTKKGLSIDLSSLFLGSYVYGVLDGTAKTETADHDAFGDILDGDEFTATMTLTSPGALSGAGKVKVGANYATAYAAAADGDSGNYDITNTVLTGTIGVTQKAISLNLANLFANSYEYGILDNTAKTETFATNATTGIFTNDVVTASMTLDTPGTLSGAGKAKVNSGYATTYALAGGADAGNYAISTTGLTGTVAVTKKNLNVDLSTLFQSSYEYGILGSGAYGATANNSAFGGILTNDTFTVNMTVTNPGTLSGASKVQVGTGYATAYVAAAAADDDSGNYNVTHSGSAGSVNVTQKDLTLDLAYFFGPSYGYGVLDGSDVSELLTNFDFGTIFAGDTVEAVMSITSDLTGMKSGAGYLKVSPNAYSREVEPGTTGDTGNYNITITNVADTFTVTPKAVSLDLSSLFLSSYEYGVLDGTAKTETINPADFIAEGLLANDALTGVMNITSDLTGLKSGAGKLMADQSYTRSVGVSGTDAGNYNVTVHGVGSNVSVTKKALSLDLSSIFDSSYEYGVLDDSSVIETIATGSTTGIYLNDEVLADMDFTSPTSLSNAGKLNVNPAYDVAFGLAGGADSGNYVITATGLTGTIEVYKKDVALDLSSIFGSSYVYGILDGSNVSEMIDDSIDAEIFNGDWFTATGVTTYNSTTDHSSSGKLNVGSYARTVGFSDGDSGNYNITDTGISASVEVYKKDVSLDLSSIFGGSYVYGILDGSDVTGTVNSGLVGSDWFTATGVTAYDPSTDISGAGKLNVGSYERTIGFDNGDFGNYNVTGTGVDATFAVTQKDLTLDLAYLFGPSYEYGLLDGSGVSELLTNTDFGAIFNGDTVEAVMSITSDLTDMLSGAGKLKVSTYTRTTEAGTDHDTGNYAITITGVNSSFAVNQKSVTLDLSSIFGSAYEYGILDGSAVSETINPADFITEGLLAGDALTATMDFTGDLTGMTSGAGKLKAGSSYARSTALGGDDIGNYDINVQGVGGNVTVTQKNISLNLASLFDSSYEYGILDGYDRAQIIDTASTDILTGDELLAVMTFTDNLDGMRSSAGKLKVNQSYATAFGINASGDSANYAVSITGDTGTVEVYQKNVTLDLSGIFGDSYTYGDLSGSAVTEVIGDNYGGILGGDWFNASGAIAYNATDISGAGKLNVGSYARTVGFSDGDSENYNVSVTGVGNTVAVNKYTFTLSDSGLAGQYGHLTDTGALAALLNRVNEEIGTLFGGDSVTGVADNGLGYSSSNHLRADEYASNSLILTGNDAGNYDITRGAFEVTPYAFVLPGSGLAGQYGHLTSTDALAALLNHVNANLFGSDWVGGVLDSGLGYSGADYLKAGQYASNPLVLDGGDASNYVVTRDAFEVTQKNVTLDLSSLFGSGYEYGMLDGTDVVKTVNNSYGLLDGDSFAATGTISYNPTTNLSGAGKLNVGTYARAIGISGGDSGNYSVNITGVDNTFVVSPRIVSATGASGLSVEYGTQWDDIARQLDNNIGSGAYLAADDVSHEYLSKGSINNYGRHDVGSHTASLAHTGADAGNYVFENANVDGSISATFAVYAKALAVNEAFLKAIYGDAIDLTLSADFLSGYFTDGETPVVSGSLYLTQSGQEVTGRLNAGTYGIGASADFSLGNYTVDLGALSFTIDKRHIEITADEVIYYLGMPFPTEFGYTFTGGAGIVTGDDYAIALATTATSQSTVGSYDIVEDTIWFGDVNNTNYTYEVIGENRFVVTTPLSDDGEKDIEVYLPGSSDTTTKGPGVNAPTVLGGGDGDIEGDLVNTTHADNNGFLNTTILESRFAEYIDANFERFVGMLFPNGVSTVALEGFLSGGESGLQASVAGLKQGIANYLGTSEGRALAGQTRELIGNSNMSDEEIVEWLTKLISERLSLEFETLLDSVSSADVDVLQGVIREVAAYVLELVTSGTDA